MVSFPRILRLILRLLFSGLFSSKNLNRLKFKTIWTTVYYFSESYLKNIIFSESNLTNRVCHEPVILNPKYNYRNPSFPLMSLSLLILGPDEMILLKGFFEVSNKFSQSSLSDLSDSSFDD